VAIAFDLLQGDTSDKLEIRESYMQHTYMDMAYMVAMLMCLQRGRRAHPMRKDMYTEAACASSR